MWMGNGLASTGPASAPASAARAGSSWLASRAPAGATRPAAIGSRAFLNGVYCTGRSNCWAVGLQRLSNNAQANQIVHWNGKSWRQVKAPNPAGTGAAAMNTLAAVRCTSAKDCWAVGSAQKNNTSATLNEMLRWNGRAWFATATPQPAGTGTNSRNSLTDVTCISARNCWATGSFSKAGSGTINQMLHWNGKTWSRRPVPEPGGTTPQSVNRLISVRCPTSSKCLAVGLYIPATGGTFNQAQSWSGRSWATQHVPSPLLGASAHASTLYSLGCGARNSCWAVGILGRLGVNQSVSQALHWNGRSWSRVFTAQPAGFGVAAQNDLLWVNCTADRNCWAVGSYGRSGPGQIFRNLAQHWNGKRWNVVFTPNPAGAAAGDENVLFSVRCTDASYCWAVGGQEKSLGGVSDEFLHWNGKKWSVWS